MRDVEPTNCDNFSLSERLEYLVASFFPDLEKQTNGIFTTDRLVSATSILDIGIGRGAVAKYIRDRRGGGKIVGVDWVRGYEEPTAYNCYSSIEWGDIKDEKIIQALAADRFDFIISIGIDQISAQSLMKNKDRFNLLPSGLMIVAVDRGDDVKEFKEYGFNHCKGAWWDDGNIYFWENKRDFQG